MEDILTWQTLVFTLAIFIFSFLLRRTLEVLFPTLSRGTPLSMAQRVWEELLLPSTPVLVGALMGGLLKNWLYPPALVTTGQHIIYGVVCGFFSGYAYKILKSLLTQKFSVELPDVPGAPQDPPQLPPPGSSGGKGG